MDKSFLYIRMIDLIEINKLKNKKNNFNLLTIIFFSVK